MRGGIWLMLGDGVARVATILKLAILGRLLSPNDFGLVGIAIIALKWLEYFTETGFNAALIQRPGDIRPYLDTAWSVQVLRSLGLAGVLLIGAPLGAWFFGNPEATPIIRSVALVTMFRGFINPAVVYLRKELDFQSEVIWRLSGVIAGLVVAIPLAFAYGNVWALMLAVIAAQIAETLVSYWIEPYRPRPRLEWARATELMRFGKWIFWSNIVAFLGLYADSLAVGKMLGATALGLYQMAHGFALLPTVQIGIHVSGVTFPVFSKLEGTRDVRRAFLLTLAPVFSLVAPIGCFLTVFGEPLVRVVLGGQWASISPTLQILAWAGVATALTGITHSLFLGVGKPDIPVRASLLKVVVFVGLLYPLVTSLGLIGVALAVTMATLAATAYQLVLVTRLIQPTGLEIVRAVKVGAFGSMPFLGAGLLVSGSPSPWLFFIATLAIGLYLAILVAALRFHPGLGISFSPSSKPCERASALD